MIALWSWHRVQRTQRKIRYVMDATLSNDFAYHFQEDDPQGINAWLNKIVAHLQTLTENARNTDAYYGLILDQALTGIVIMEDNGNVTHVNKAALRLLNMTVLTHIAQIQHKAPPFYSALSLNLPICNVNGKEFTIAVTKTTLAGKCLHIVAINDISRPMQTKEDESWIKLTRVLTHEIMNSLTPVNSITETLRKQIHNIKPNELEDSLSTIATCNHSLMNFVENFRKFTIIPSPQRTAFELKPFLQSAIQIGHEIGMHIRFELTIEPDDIMLYADPGMMHQVIVNIIKNAVEAKPQHIAIRAYVNQDESVQIEVENDGELIPEEIAEHIFVPFFTTRSHGSGIGLSLSRRYVIANGGSLSLSLTPHTCFTIIL